MKRIVRLTESELKNIVEASVRRAIKEGAVDESWKGTLAGGALGAAALTAGVGAGAFDDQMDDIDRNSRAFPEDRVEYGDRLKPQSELPSDTISWEKANQFEGKISKAIAESISNLMNEAAWTDSQGVQHTDQHGNDRAAWEKLRKERWNRYATKTVDGMTNKEKNAHLKNAEASCRNGSFEEALPDKRGDRRPGMAKARMENSKDIQAHRKKWYN